MRVKVCDDTREYRTKILVEMRDDKIEDGTKSLVEVCDDTRERDSLPPIDPISCQFEFSRKEKYYCDGPKPWSEKLLRKYYEPR